MSSLQTGRSSGEASTLAAEVRARIDGLSYLPTTAAVAIKFVELGKDPDAEPADYARIISADGSLSSKLLALANSSWAGVRTRVTTVKTAVNLLGLATVRTLAISYCMTGLHNELRLPPGEAERFWEAGLCKAVASKQLAQRMNAKSADEAFVAGLFQDFALAVLYSVAREKYLELLQAPTGGVRALLEAERTLFGMDHSEVGRAVAQKLELPELFVDTVAFHHDYGTLSEFVENAALRCGCYAAALLPHVLNSWNPEDRSVLERFLQEHAPDLTLESFIDEVQKEFNPLYGYFNEGRLPAAHLEDLLVATAREAADQTTELVGRVQEIIQDAAARGTPLGSKGRETDDGTRRDPLTGILTRDAFRADAEGVLAQAARYKTSLSLLYVDVDHFKQISAACGAAVTDRILTRVAAAMQAALPPAALHARLGVDEFAVLLGGFAPPEVAALAERILRELGALPVRGGAGDGRATLSASIGVVHVQPRAPAQRFDDLVGAAEKLMYAAKRAGRNRIETQII